eukprot:4108099-Pleurochrysis_carterae.AAC.2
MQLRACTHALATTDSRRDSAAAPSPPFRPCFAELHSPFRPSLRCSEPDRASNARRSPQPLGLAKPIAKPIACAALCLNAWTQVALAFLRELEVPDDADDAPVAALTHRGAQRYFERQASDEVKPAALSFGAKAGAAGFGGSGHVKKLT